MLVLPEPLRYSTVGLYIDLGVSEKAECRELDALKENKNQ